MMSIFNTDENFPKGAWSGSRDPFQRLAIGPPAYSAVASCNQFYPQAQIAINY